MDDTEEIDVRSFGVGAAIVGVACVLLIVAARAIGNAQPPPVRLSELHLTDCALPCWLGIIPGQTTFDEGVERVRAVYPQALFTLEYAQVAAAMRAEAPFGQISLAGGYDGVIRDISLRTATLEGVALGDVVNLLGAPTRPAGVRPLAAFYQCENSLTIVSVGGMHGGWEQALGIIGIRGNGPETCTVVRR